MFISLNILAPQLGLFFWTTLLFLVFFFILKKFAWKPILNALKEREDSIQNSLNEAEKARDEMAKLQSDNEALLKEARQESNRILKDANALRDDIISKAKKEAQEVAGKEMEKAKQQIDTEKQAALTEIKNTTGKLAVEIAEKILRKNLDNKPEQESFAQRLVSELSNN